MLTIKVSSGDPKFSKLFLRQSPGGKGIWRNCHFIVNEEVEQCDWWVVCHFSGLRKIEETLCSPDHLIYISMEPKEYFTTEKFLNQFSKLVLCDREIKHPNIIYRNGLTWWAGLTVHHECGHHFTTDGMLTFEKLISMPFPNKTKMMSIICSGNRGLSGHMKRLDFLERLDKHPIGASIDFYGGGLNPVDDKMDAILPYRYTIALENCSVLNYWSEKLADAYLGFALPIYYGCPNIHEYFAAQALNIIDIDDFDKSMAMIEDTLEKDPYEAHFEAIVQARKQVLNEYNIFQLMADICQEPAKRLVKCRLKPCGHFERSWPRRIARKVIYTLRGIEETR
jgi:Glycosyltransferase family 10 (fucosyltransferase).